MDSTKQFKGYISQILHNLIQKIEEEGTLANSLMRRNRDAKARQKQYTKNL